MPGRLDQGEVQMVLTSPMSLVPAASPTSHSNASPQDPE
jgi:hypothetical protein